jgi:hypothetical protein
MTEQPMTEQPKENKDKIQTITVTDVDGQERVIDISEFGKHGFFPLDAGETALIIKEFEDDGSRYMSSHLIVPKPANPNDNAPTSVLFATAISLRMKDSFFIKEQISWLTANIDKLRASK